MEALLEELEEPDPNNALPEGDAAESDSVRFERSGAQWGVSKPADGGGCHRLVAPLRTRSPSCSTQPRRPVRRCGMSAAVCVWGYERLRVQLHKVAEKAHKAMDKVHKAVGGAVNKAKSLFGKAAMDKVHKAVGGAVNKAKSLFGKAAAAVKSAAQSIEDKARAAPWAHGWRPLTGPGRRRRKRRWTTSSPSRAR